MLECTRLRQAPVPGGSDSKESACTWDMKVRSLDQQNPLEKVMATDSSILAWRSLVGYGTWGHEESDTTE